MMVEQKPNNNFVFAINEMGYYSTYYTYGLPTFLIVVIALYLLFTGNPTYSGAALNGF
jgi:hypothetical protein